MGELGSYGHYGYYIACAYTIVLLGLGALFMNSLWAHRALKKRLQVRCKYDLK